ncbi:hypothetical protein DFH09DRAFT_1079536 [Mycena vulgaris]|nr:hypothetical protein DFH09DRAFT_1079536 [Mycena vulgaris]
MFMQQQCNFAVEWLGYCHKPKSERCPHAGTQRQETIEAELWTWDPWEEPCWLLSTATSHSGSVLLPPNLRLNGMLKSMAKSAGIDLPPASALSAQLVLSRSPRRIRLTLTVRAGFSSPLPEFLTRDVGVCVSCCVLPILCTLASFILCSASGAISTPEVYSARHSRGGVKADSGRRSAGALRGIVFLLKAQFIPWLNEKGWLGAFVAGARVEPAPSGYSFSATIYILLVHTVPYPACVHAGVSRYE